MQRKLSNPDPVTTHPFPLHFPSLHLSDFPTSLYFSFHFISSNHPPRHYFPFLTHLEFCICHSSCISSSLPPNLLIHWPSPPLPPPVEQPIHLYINLFSVSSSRRHLTQWKLLSHWGDSRKDPSFPLYAMWCLNTAFSPAVWDPHGGLAL